MEMRWSNNFAYAIGLITTDGSLSKNGRSLDVTSKDREQLENYMRCLGIEKKIGKKRSGAGNESLRVQIGDKVLYDFLIHIGLMPNKSKRLGKLRIPRKYFLDFLRGHFDGDGSFHSYRDKRWKSSFMFYTSFVSASRAHIEWLRETIGDALGIRGHITHAEKSSIYQLKYAKRESLVVLHAMYRDKKAPSLSRKKLKIEGVLGIVGESLQSPGGEMANALP